jgi:hypothetical protein
MAKRRSRLKVCSFLLVKSPLRGRNQSKIWTRGHTLPRLIFHGPRPQETIMTHEELARVAPGETLIFSGMSVTFIEKGTAEHEGDVRIQYPNGIKTWFRNSESGIVAALFSRPEND